MVKDYPTIAHRKIELINRITQLNDVNILSSIEKIFTKNKADWWETISDEEKNAIEEGLDDIRNGRVIPHAEVMQEIKFRELLLSAPTWTDEEYENYKENRNRFNQWKIK